MPWPRARSTRARYRFEHELVDIETLNRRAFAGELELTAVSLHAYAHLTDRYVLCPCGASMGDRYGPMVVARRGLTARRIGRHATIAVPGTLTTAYLALRLCSGRGLHARRRAVRPDPRRGRPRANTRGDRIDAGLIIHEGQLTYGRPGPRAGRRHRPVVVPDETGLPLPLGANAIRRDLGPEAIRDVHRLLRESIEYGLEHREEALDYALGFGRGLDRSKADQFVGMYVNDWTLDFGPVGRQAVARLLAEAMPPESFPGWSVPEFVA